MLLDKCKRCRQNKRKTCFKEILVRRQSRAHANDERESDTPEMCVSSTPYNDLLSASAGGLGTLSTVSPTRRKTTWWDEETGSG